MELKGYQEEEELWLEEQELIDEARESMFDFTLYVRPKYIVNWHHKILCKYLDMFVNKEIKRLMVFMPPRHGKSELVSRHLPTYIFGKNPDAQVIGCSYAANLANRMSRDVQRIMKNESYQDVFPIELAEKKKSQDRAKKTASLFEIVGHRGGYRAAGVRGGITGMGGDYIIIDDPVKDRAEADSPTIRDAVWQWYTSTLYTRLEQNASLLITMTRWHEDDLAGRLIEAMKYNEGADKWTILNLPAIKEEHGNPDDPREIGEALWPWKKSIADFEIIKSQNNRDFLALYQQAPRNEEGTIIKREWWKFYDERPTEFDEEIQSWDLSFKDGDSSDYVVGQVWGRKGSNKYLLDQVRGKFSFTKTLEVFANLSTKWPNATAKYVEEAANGAALIDTLKNKITGIIPVKPKSSKIARIQSVTPQIEAGNVWLPNSTIAPWINDYIEEHAGFPYAKNDDQCDGTSQALMKLNKSNAGALDWSPVSLTKTSRWA